MNSGDHYALIGESHIDHGIGVVSQMLLASPFVLAWILYLVAVFHSNKRHKRWPIYRTINWSFGMLLAIIAVAGPLANRSHTDFTTHMLGHLLLGMLAPLLLVLAAPMTLVLRTLSISNARRLASIVKSQPVQWLAHPIVTSFLNIGGLWLLYTTKLYTSMHEYTLLFLIVHFHVFAAGYLFTASFIYIDPVSHRIPYFTRAAVLTTALAGHGILSKYIYAHPPIGVPKEQAEIGGMLMYYGGDLIDAMIIFMLCLQWYRAARPRAKVAIGQ